MDNFDATLRSLTPDELWYLAGILVARGKFYIGSTPRGTTVRYTPSLTVELSAPDDVPVLSALFGPAQERNYYSRLVYRFVLQDCAKIAALLDRVPLPPVRVRARADALADFCTSVTPGERALAFAAYRRLVEVL